ncbi:winged helix DNA-binding domain-containing protein, partial [Artomyces pyxidatus]
MHTHDSASPDPTSPPDATGHLRALLNAGPADEIGLKALADPPPGEKPDYPLPTLIKLAIHGSKNKRLTLQEIYTALEDRFTWFRERTSGPGAAWKNSIRHNLSLRKCFLRVERPITEPGKGSYWMIDPAQGEGNKRVRKR